MTIVDSQDSLRLSILVALGLTSCAGATQSPSSSGESTSVVTIAPDSSGAQAVDPPDPDDPGIPVIPSRIGWVTESNGNVHRATITSCDPVIDLPACKGTEGHMMCKTDADCTAHRFGKCVTGFGQIGDYCACRYSCANDSDCGANEACVCKGIGRQNEGHSVCAAASCSTDGDCESKQCGLSVYNNGCGSQASLVCRTKDDTCKSDKDCMARGGQCVVPRPEQDPKWQCGIRSCVIGRPLVVEGAPRAADSKPRSDWLARLSLDVDMLDTASRKAATNHYGAVAAMEHASVASFARFSLQLLALGAPAHLVQDAHRAALDEIEHARTNYSLLSLFGKENVGPDKLPAAIANIEVGIEEFVMALVAEGCVGETLGAAEGLRAAQSVTSADLAAVLFAIADDEERHATLAWRTLKWALETFGEGARGAAAKAFASASATYAADPPVPYAVPQVGILSAKDLGTLRRAVLSTVIAPCARALGIPFRSADIV